MCYLFMYCCGNLIFIWSIQLHLINLFIPRMVDGRQNVIWLWKNELLDPWCIMDHCCSFIKQWWLQSLWVNNPKYWRGLRELLVSIDNLISSILDWIVFKTFFSILISSYYKLSVSLFFSLKYYQNVQTISDMRCTLQLWCKKRMLPHRRGAK